MAGLRIIIAILVNLALVKGGTEVAQNYTHLGIYANAIGKAHYNPWACNYRSEPGYKCISCSAALHCFPANFALLVQCAGLFPFCRNGYCSRFRTDGCYEEHTFAEGTHGPLRLTTMSNKATTSMPEVNEATTAMTEANERTTLMTEVNEGTTAMTDVNERTTAMNDVNERTTAMTEVNEATTVMSEVNEVTPYYSILQQFLDGGDFSKVSKVEEVAPPTLTARTNQQTNSGKDRRR